MQCAGYAAKVVAWHILQTDCNLRHKWLNWKRYTTRLSSHRGKRRMDNIKVKAEAYHGVSVSFHNLDRK